MLVLGINAVFHDSSAALVEDGRIIAAAEEERFSRRKHAKRPVPFSAWEMPGHAARWCLQRAGRTAGELDAVAYSYDPDLVDHDLPGMESEWEHLRTTFARRAGKFLRTELSGLDPDCVRFVPHHVAHAASAALAGPYPDCAVLVADGRGERASHLAGECRDGKLERLAAQELPHSLGLLYEDLTEHLGFARSSDEYKVMALASHGNPRFLGEIEKAVRATGDGGFRCAPVDLSRFAAPRPPGDTWSAAHADLAASVQHAVENVLLDLACWLHRQTGQPNLTLAGGVALNCVANTRLHAESPFDNVWVQPAAGDAGTALGAALQVSTELGARPMAMSGADLGREWTDDELETTLRQAKVRYRRPHDVADAVAEALTDDRIVAWFQGRAEFGPRALGHRSLLAHPGRRENLERLNDVKGREQFRPVAPMVRQERSADLFSRGPMPSPYMLFVHDVAEQWQHRIPAVTHIDGTARIQTVDQNDEPLLAAMLDGFERRTGLPAVINTSLNTAGRPMVDSPADALECFGSAPVDVLAIGPFLVERA